MLIFEALHVEMELLGLQFSLAKSKIIVSCLYDTFKSVHACSDAIAVLGET